LDEGTLAQLSAVRRAWEEAVLTYRTFNTVQQGATSAQETNHHCFLANVPENFEL
jgi:hypothetical protein